MPDAPPKVLVVEDDRMNSYFFELTLQRKGRLATTATDNVDDILRLARAREVDLIVLDVTLANSQYQGRNVDGVEIARLLKNDPTTRSIPIILATAHALKGDRENLLRESGAEDYVSKPVTDPQQFIDKVKSLLRAAGKILPPPPSSTSG